jgi:hypothetical protein
VQAQVREGYKQVYCQRFFSSRHRSQYFEVRPTTQGQPDAPQVVPVDSNAA